MCIYEPSNIRVYEGAILIHNGDRQSASRYGSRSLVARYLVMRYVASALRRVIHW